MTERLEVPASSRKAVIRNAKLTPKEQEVVGHLLRGEENKVIAKALGMSWRTVQKHLERIYQKPVPRNEQEARSILREFGRKMLCCSVLTYKEGP